MDVLRPIFDRIQALRSKPSSESPKTRQRDGLDPRWDHIRSLIERVDRDQALSESRIHQIVTGHDGFFLVHYDWISQNSTSEPSNYYPVNRQYINNLVRLIDAFT